MTWNWQLPAWPKFTYDAEPLREKEAAFLHGSGLLLGAFAHLDEDDGARVRVALISDEALETSRIEGELLNRESLQSSVRRQFGLPTDSRKVPAAEQGVARVMVDVYLNFSDDLTAKRLCHWQELLMSGKIGIQDVGRFRKSAEPMQIVSGALHDPKVHFEAIPSSKVAEEMKRFLHWFNGSNGKIPALARAALAHVYFESIHPFEDGNGRVGRAIAELALSQALGKPAILALSQTISRNKKAYYGALETINRTLEVTPWVEYFAATILEAQRRAGIQVEFVLEKAKFFDRYRGKLNERQEKVLLRIFAEGPEGFAGGLSAGNYQSITGASAATTTRDLAQLVELGALGRTGERKHARYWLNAPHHSSSI